MKSFQQFMEVVENPSRNLKKQATAAAKRVDVDFDGDVDKNDTTYGGDYGEFVPSADGKKKLKTGKVKFATESSSEEQRDRMKARMQATRDKQRAGLEKNKATNKRNNDRNKMRAKANIERNNQQQAEREMEPRRLTPTERLMSRR